MRYYEDVSVGEVARFGAYAVTREEVLAFARAYDPQPFHLSDEAAAGTYFGRLAASGWHSCAMTMRMAVDHFADTGQASLGSPGVESLQFLHPVYPGDTLRCELAVLEKRRSQSRPEMGIVKSRMRVFNQDDVPVLTYVANGLIATRPA